MKIRLIFPALVVYVLAVTLLSGAAQQATATEIAFVQGNQPRQGQNQRGLSPEKKKSLSKLGPEDAFPGADEPEDNRRPAARTTAPARTTSAPKYSPSPKRSATPVATPSLTLAPAISAGLSPTAAAVSQRNPVQQSTPAPLSSTAQPASDWTVSVLSGLALIVSVALIYVLIKLREKIREGS